MRKHDGRGGVAVRDSSLLSPLGLTRGSRAMSPYFGGVLRGKKSGIHVAWMLAFASMTIEVEPASGTPLHRHPWAWPEGPGQ